MYPRSRTHASGALLLILMLALLPRTEHAFADDRVLMVHDGATVRSYEVSELVTAIGLTKLRVPKDPRLGPDRVYIGFALGPLLKHIGLDDAPELLLVSADGYRIPFDASALSQRPVHGLLALRDAALPAGSKTHWREYRHGAETISFDPFYLVWTATDENIDFDTETLPWPFQLTAIQRFDRDAYFAAARPPAGTDDAAQHGFKVYTAHCGKCHRMRGVGGEVGPALDRDHSLSSLLSKAQLMDYVRHDKSQFPQSKMPSFSKLLSRTEIDQVTAYLRAMQPAK